MKVIFINEWYVVDTWNANLNVTVVISKLIRKVFLCYFQCLKLKENGDSKQLITIILQKIANTQLIIIIT